MKLKFLYTIKLYLVVFVLFNIIYLTKLEKPTQKNRKNSRVLTSTSTENKIESPDEEFYKQNKTFNNNDNKKNLNFDKNKKPKSHNNQLKFNNNKNSQNKQRKSLPSLSNSSQKITINSLSSKESNTSNSSSKNPTSNTSSVSVVSNPTNKNSSQIKKTLRLSDFDELNSLKQRVSKNI